MSEIKKKSERAVWFISLRHWLFSFHILPLGIWFLLSLAVSYLGFDKSSLGSISTSLIVISVILMLSLQSVVVWFGTYISAGWISEAYRIKDKDEVIRLCLIFILVVTVLSFARELFSPSESKLFDSSLVLGNAEMVIGKLVFIANLFIFYFASKKYIK